MSTPDPRRRLAPEETAHEFSMRLAPNVYAFHGDFRKYHANQGWIIFADFVLVIDASMPSGAAQTLRLIRETTDKPIKYVLITHHHPDHDYGGQIWREAGAELLASPLISADIAANEPGLWQLVEPIYPELKDAQFVAPTFFVGDGTLFDDGHHRLELIAKGGGHTHADMMAWLPHERVLFLGDVAANGAHNVLAFSVSVTAWCTLLQGLRDFPAEVVVPGHGPWGGMEIVHDQLAYFEALLTEARELRTQGVLRDGVSHEVERIRADLLTRPAIARYVLRPEDEQPGIMTMQSQIERVYDEVTTAMG